MAKKILSLISKHKIITVIIVVLVAGGGYYLQQRSTAVSGETRYVLGTVQKGTIIATVAGTGQVSASNQLDIKPKVSGTIISVTVQQGQTVKSGALIAQIDATDALKAVRDAKANLESAQLSLQKLQQPATDLALLQAQNTLDKNTETKQATQDDLNTAYNDGYTDVSNSYLDLPTVMTGLQNTIFGTGNGSAIQANVDFYADSVSSYASQVLVLRDDVFAKYAVARDAYDTNFADYKVIDRSADTATIESLISETYSTSEDISDVIKSMNNLIQFYKDKLTERNMKPAAIADTNLTALNTYTGQVNGHLSTLLADLNAIQNDKNAVINIQRTIEESSASLAMLKTGADPLDIRSSKLTVQQRQNALTDAQSTLADYSIRAPFDGVIAVLPAVKGDPASSGTSIATMTTPKQIATITLNEVDVAKVNVGDKVTLTFDAISDLSITGEVASVDTIGTVSQGVVTYEVKISFDTQDARVKPGMSVSAAIITDMKQDVLTVPNGAIKTQGTTHYVQMLDNPGPAVTGVQGVTSVTAPRDQQVEIGLANDTNTEIVSGLNEGDSVITRTIAPTSKTTTTQAPSLFGGGGTNRAVRVGG